MYVYMYIPALWLARFMNTGLWLVRNVYCSMHWTPARTLCLSFRALSSKYQGQENLIFTLNTSESMRYVVSFSPPGPNVAPFILSSSDPQLFFAAKLAWKTWRANILWSAILSLTTSYVLLSSGNVQQYTKKLDLQTIETIPKISFFQRSPSK